MFKELYKKDNEFIKPDLRFIEELALKMRNESAGNSNISAQTRKFKFSNKIPYISAAAAACILITAVIILPQKKYDKESLYNLADSAPGNDYNEGIKTEAAGFDVIEVPCDIESDEILEAEDYGIYNNADGTVLTEERSNGQSLPDGFNYEADSPAGGFRPEPADDVITVRIRYIGEYTTDYIFMPYEYFFGSGGENGSLLEGYNFEEYFIYNSEPYIEISSDTDIITLIYEDIKPVLFNELLRLFEDRDD